MHIGGDQPIPLCPLLSHPRDENPWDPTTFSNPLEDPQDVGLGDPQVIGLEDPHTIGYYSYRITHRYFKYFFL